MISCKYSLQLVCDELNVTIQPTDIDIFDQYRNKYKSLSTCHNTMKHEKKFKEMSCSIQNYSWSKEIKKRTSVRGMFPNI